MMNKELVLSLMQQGHVTDILKKNENDLYVKFLLLFAWVYYHFFNTVRDFDDVNKALKQWKKAFSFYSKKAFTLKQKINFFLYTTFPRIKYISIKIKNKFFLQNNLN